MKKFNYKSRKGFTLIELLVVIGILAVLAAIAIPSVAGLIDRANVSADDTNANEMTNAIERFTSEYELFCQDIASGRFNKNNMDAAQSRVYNVTGAEDRDDIKSLESEDGLGDKKINRDTKYPENVATAKSIVENYTKTSSATYEPKQSDMNFYYSPDCGVVVFSEATDEPNVEELNKLIISGKDAKGKEVSSSTRWINLTTGENSTNVSNNLTHGNNVGDLIPEGATYFDASTNTTLIAGKSFPETTDLGDIYTYGEYKYTYENIDISEGSSSGYNYAGWHVSVVEKNKIEYKENVLSAINKKPLISMAELFADNGTLVNISSNFTVPSTVLSTFDMFRYNYSLKEIPNTFRFPNGILNIAGTFFGCHTITKLPSSLSIPSTVKFANCVVTECKKLEYLPNGFILPNTLDVNDYGREFFWQCESLKTLPNGFFLPEQYTNIENMFMECYALKSLPNSFVIHDKVENMNAAFCECPSLSGVIKIDSNTTQYTSMFSIINNYDNIGSITLTGSSSNLTAIANGASSGRATVA